MEMMGNGRGMPKAQFVLEVCRQSLNNACQRQLCRYAHPPENVKIIDGQVECCGDFMKGKCYRVNPRCRFYHPPAHIVATLLSSVGSRAFKDDKRGMISTLTHAIANCSAVLNAALAASGSNGPKSDKMEVCRDFLNDRCQRDDCRFAHPPTHVTIDAHHRVMTCIDYLNGKCGRDECRYFHPPPYLMKERCPSSICKDYLRGRCDRNPCRFLHSADMKEVDDRTRELMTCRDYLNGKCSRAVCCYYHPPESSDDPTADAAVAKPREAKPAAAYAPAAQTAGGARPTKDIEICRDFLLGRCHRPQCCYAHPTDRNLVVDKQAEMVCKDFLRGLCRRPDCRYFHPPIQPVRSQQQAGGMMLRETSYPMESGYGNSVSRKRGYGGEPVASDYPRFNSLAYSFDYSHSSQPSNWESYQTPAKRQMVDDYY